MTLRKKIYYILLVAFTVSNCYSQNHDSTFHFKLAVDEICQMLNGSAPLSFKRAVFLTENAYYGGHLSWTEFKAEIEQAKSQVNKIVVRKKLQQYKTGNNYAIFSYIIDSIPENDYTPYKYDFDNFMGDSDYESFMVSHLLKTRKGNCHSLPYFYKILANEMQANAYLATAPMHIYIRHRDEKEQWWNLELTSGTFSRTSFIIESFNVSDAGIESGLYMKALSEKESIALCLSDLIDYYDKKIGIYYDSIVAQAYTEGLKVYPNSLLQLQKGDAIKYILDKKMYAMGITSYDDLPLYPNLLSLYQEYIKTKGYIQKMGYIKLPPEKYNEKVREIEHRKK